MSNHKLLLVDDSPNVLKALTRTFSISDRYTLFTALSAREAMDILGREEIDLLITDENMPETPGTELLNTTRALYPNVVRFMLTGETDIAIAQKAINNGEIYRFFCKPWDDFELLISVRYALKQKKLENENNQLKSVVKKQERLLRKLEEKYPGITERKLTDGSALIMDGEK